MMGFFHAILDFCLYSPEATNARFCCGVPRDSRWYKESREYLADDGHGQPRRCIVCGGPADTVHHAIPVSVDKGREMDRANWRAMCNRNNCHGLIAHNGCRYRTYNKHLDTDADRILRRIESAIQASQPKALCGED